jgi:uncharacterized membrane protein
MSDQQRENGIVPAAPPNGAEAVQPPILEEPPKHSFGSRIRNYFLTGLILTGPLFITIYLTWAFVTWVDNLVQPFIPVAYRPETYLPVKIPGSGLIIAFVALTMLGFLTANLVGRTLVEMSEMLLGRMPIVRAIYKSLKQVFETLFSKSGTSFRKVGLVEYPAPGMWSLVFLSQPPAAQISERLPGAEEHVSVFLPCTPNPTTGFFFYIPRRDIIELDLPPEAAATLIMSAGMIQPASKSAEQQKKFAALAGAALAARNTRETPAPPAKAPRPTAAAK